MGAEEIRHAGLSVSGSSQFLSLSSRSALAISIISGHGYGHGLIRVSFSDKVMDEA
jgi:hypothetical protein